MPEITVSVYPRGLVHGNQCSCYILVILVAEETAPGCHGYDACVAKIETLLHVIGPNVCRDSCVVTGERVTQVCRWWFR